MSNVRFLFALVCAVACAQIVLSQSEGELQCLESIGGTSNLLEKQLVSQEPYDDKNQFLESTITGPYRIVRPGEPVTDDLRPDRITITVDDNNVITDAECI